MMQLTSNSRRISRVLRTSISIQWDRVIVSEIEKLEDSNGSSQCLNKRRFSAHTSNVSGTIHGFSWPAITNSQPLRCHPMCSMMARASFVSEASMTEEAPTEAVKEIYDKMLKSVEAETMPPNAWMWSLIENCANKEDIKLLFQILQNIRRFRLSNLRIHSNFNCNLCLRVTEACARVGALDFGKKALWKHNVYGLTPSIGSAHYLLMYAKEHKDVKLMEEIFKLLKRNQLPLQPGTADIIFSICYDTDNWELISKYSKKFVKAGVKLRRTTFGIWMKFAAKIGDTESLWKIEKLRSDSMNKHNLVSGFSCAKGFLLEQKPENAAAILHIINQNLPEKKRPDFPDELQRLVSEWPLEVTKNQKEGDRKALATSLKRDIPTMITCLLNMGLEVKVNLDYLAKEGAFLG